MKKLYIFCFVALLTATASGCTPNNSSLTNSANSMTEANKDSKTTEPEVVLVEGDRIIYNDLTSLVNASDLVVIGKFIQDTEQNIEYTYSEEFGKDIVTDATSTNIILVEKVLAGETDEKELKISQRYGLVEDTNQLIVFSEMTPMNNGDEWIFFLYYDEVYDTYWCAGDYTGRYPVPSNDATISKENSISAADFGVYDANIININLYNEIISTFDCTTK